MSHAKLSEHQALRHKLKSCTVPILYRSDLVKSRRMLYVYRPDVCNCTMPYVPRTVPAYAVRDPAYTAEVFALTLVQIDVVREAFLQPQKRADKCQVPNCYCYTFPNISVKLQIEGVTQILQFLLKLWNYNYSKSLVQQCVKKNDSTIYLLQLQNKF